MNTAANMDVQLATMLANGTALPLLFCVPILVKDNFDFMDGKYTRCQYACADCFDAIRHSKYYKLCSGHMPGALFVNCSRLWEMLEAITDNAGNIAVLTLALLCTVGHLATANGAVALLDNFPSMDATEVAQAKAYGAIILAHGNMAEWAFTNAISIGSGQLSITQHGLLISHDLTALHHCYTAL